VKAKETISQAKLNANERVETAERKALLSRQNAMDEMALIRKQSEDAIAAIGNKTNLDITRMKEEI